MVNQFLLAGILGIGIATAGYAQSFVESPVESVDFRGVCLSPEAERIDKALRQHANADFYEESLEDVFAELTKDHDIAILIHDSARDYGLDGDSLVAIRVSGIPMVSLLGNILEPFDCTITVHQDVLKIVSVDYASDMMEKRIYDCSALVQKTEAGDTEQVIHLIQETVDPDSWDVGGGTARIAEIDGKMVVTQTLVNHLTIERLLTTLDRQLGQ